MNRRWWQGILWNNHKAKEGTDVVRYQSGPRREGEVGGEALPPREEPAVELERGSRLETVNREAAIKADSNSGMPIAFEEDPQR